MSIYTEVKGLGDTITCDDCNNIAENWYSGESRAICRECYSQMSISWGELVELTHAQQVERFGWCICEDPEQGQLAEDCPKREDN